MRAPAATARVRPLAVAGLLLAVVAAALVGTLRLDTAPGWPLDDLAELLAALVATLACGRRALASEGRLRRAWSAVGAGCAGWGAGQVVWTVHELWRDGAMPFPSLADAGFLLFPVGILAGVTAFPARRDRPTLRDLLDGAILALTLSATSWTVGLQPAVPGAGVVGAFAALAYPLLDVVVLTTAFLVLVRAHRHRRAIGALIAAMSAMACSDALFTYETTRGGTPGDGPSGAGWVLAFAAVTVATVLPARGRCADREDAPGVVPAHVLRRQAVLAVLPYVPLAATVAVAGIGTLRHGAIDPVTIGLLGGAVVLTFARQFLTARDNQLLLARVALQQDALARQAYRDPLTGLANRARFVDELAATLLARPVGTAGVAVLFCDLDDFKSVNDGLGHAAGDTLLADVARRLGHAVGSDGMLARLGGDEFAVLVAPAAGTDAGAAALHLAERLGDVVQAPFVVEGRSVRVGISIGLVVVPADGDRHDADTVLARADIAMYSSKRSPGRRPVAWTPGLELPEAQDWRLLPTLEQALTAGTLPAHYQPVVDLATGTVHGFEALVRWPHPADDLSPADFLPVAVRNGLVRPLTTHMLRTAARQLARWTADRAPAGPVRVSVNVSPSELVDPGLVRLVEDVVRDLSLPPGALVLEVTEDALLDDVDAAARATRALHALGVLVALDDFGSGYSALAHLTRLPFDVLKLDRQPVQDADRSPASRTLLRSVVGLAQELGLSVVAEGVERRGQAEVLLDLGCPLAQGFLFAPALPPEVVELHGRPQWAPTAAAAPLPHPR